MKKLKFRKVVLAFSALLIFLSTGCSSSIPNISLRKDFDFQNKKSVIVYVDPSENQLLDETYSRVLYLDLLARGYQVTNANFLLKENSDNISWKTHRQTADSLLVKQYLPNSDVIAVAKTSWDSALVLTYYAESRTARGKYFRFAGMYAKRLTTQLAFFDRSTREPVLSFTASDTAYLYTEDEDGKLIYSEFPWMIAAKQISKQLNEIPICKVYNPNPAKIRFKISFWVDKSYRNEFPETWKERLNLRVLYANDILRPQFDIELTIGEFIEWDSEFDKNLQNTLSSLHRAKTNKNESIQIGVTLNKELKTNWRDKDHIGLAYLFNPEIAITAQPSFPAVGQFWNPIEEAITLVHEVGHTLGAIHYDDKTSIMFPTSGTLAYDFDEINRAIIEVTKTNNFNPDKKEKVSSYLKVLNNLRKSHTASNLLILEAAKGSLSELLQSISKNDGNSSKLSSLLFSVSPDSAFAYAIEGYIEFKDNQHSLARKNFLKAIEMDSGFNEVKKYLAFISDQDDADKPSEVNEKEVKAVPNSSSPAKKK